jgi:hypothetical protein
MPEFNASFVASMQQDIVGKLFTQTGTNFTGDIIRDL